MTAAAILLLAAIQEPMVAIRTGRVAELSGRLPASVAEGADDVAWHEGWKCVLALTTEDGTAVLTIYTLAGNRRSKMVLPDTMTPSSRLFQFGNEVSFAAKSGETRARFSISSVMGRLIKKEEVTGDFDAALAPTQTAERREVLSELKKESGYPVMLGSTAKKPIRFSENGSLLSIASPELTIGKLIQGKWQSYSMNKEVSDRLGITGYEVIYTYAANTSAAFGIRSQGSILRSVLVDWRGSVPRLTRIDDGLYIPPIAEIKPD